MMGHIDVDSTPFRREHGCEPDKQLLALWTFRIQGREICFWGIYRHAEETARRFAITRGMTEGAITLLDHAAAVPCPAH